MNELLHAVTQFPSIVFTFLLGLLALYWLLVIIRLAPLELFERDSLKEDHLASTLVSLGFAGVPASLALTIILTIAAALTLAIELLVLRWLPLGLIRIPVGVVVLWATLVMASPLAAGLCHALHRGLHRYRPFTRRCLLGQTVVVTERRGEGEQAFAVIDNEPNSTIKLLSKHDALPMQGERRVLVKYLPEEGAYRSVSEQKYLETRIRLNKLRLNSKNTTLATTRRLTKPSRKVTVTAIAATAEPATAQCAASRWRCPGSFQALTGQARAVSKSAE